MEMLDIGPRPSSETFIGVCFLQDGRLVLGGSKGRLLIHESDTFDRMTSPRFGTKWRRYRLRHLGRRTIFASGAADRSIAVFDVSSFETVAFFGGHADRVWDLKCLPESSVFASAGADGVVKYLANPCR